MRSVEDVGQLSDSALLCSQEAETSARMDRHKCTSSNPVSAFAAQLLAEWRKGNPTDSVVFSPLSIAAAFLLVYKGANGQTRDEMAALFGYKVGASMARSEER